MKTKLARDQLYIIHIGYNGRELRTCRDLSLATMLIGVRDPFICVGRYIHACVHSYTRCAKT